MLAISRDGVSDVENVVRAVKSRLLKNHFSFLASALD